VADPGCLSRIPDPTFFHPGSSSKNLSILTPQKAKKWFLSSKKHDHPGSRIRIRNTALKIDKCTYNKQKNFEKKLFVVGLLKATEEKSRIRNLMVRVGDPDPYQNVTDLKH
jgi:hypothetical protein